MNQIKATYSFPANQWTIDTTSAKGGQYVEILMCFIPISTSIQLPSDFKFGLTFSRGEDLLLTGQYPDNFAKFEMTDGEPLIIERSWFAAEYDHKLTVWTRFNEETKEYSTSFKASRPDQPYPSWTWRDGFWVAPVLKPINGPYDWNEEQQQWIPAFPPDSVYAQTPMYGNEEYGVELGRVVKALNDEHHKASPLGSPGVEIAAVNLKK